MMLRPSRSDYRFAFVMLVFTVAWGILGLLWSCQPAIHGFGGLGEWDAARIGAYFPSFIVEPVSVAAEGGDIVTTWQIAEMNTRLVLVAGSWLIGVAVLWFVHRRSSRSVVLRIESWKPR